MATFYAKYPATSVTIAGTSTVQGPGTAGAQSGGVLTVQGDPAGTPIPVSGTVTASNPSVGATGAAVPASGTYIAASIAGTLTGLVATAAGLKVDGTATTQPVTGSGTAGTAAVGVVTIQGIASMTAVKVDNSAVTQPANITQFGSSNVATGTGASGAGIPRVTVSSDSSLTSVGTVSTVTAVTAITNALPAGTNIIGNVRIDQTTPGTTNGVQVTAALPAGTNKIGALTTVDTVTAVTTVSTVTAVTAITNALPAGTNAIGSVIQTATAAATFQAEGNVAFGAITNSYVTIFTPSASTKMIQMRNNMNASVSVSFDAGTTTHYILDAGDQMGLDLVANGMIMTTTAIQVKYTVGAPTSGSFRVNGAH